MPAPLQNANQATLDLWQNFNGLHQQATDQMLEVKSRFLRSHHAEKAALRGQIEELRRDIRRFSGRPEAEFDWVIDFAEVFVAGGFDISSTRFGHFNVV